MNSAVALLFGDENFTPGVSNKGENLPLHTAFAKTDGDVCQAKGEAELIYSIASVSKMYTAAAIHHLGVDLDSVIDEYPAIIKLLPNEKNLDKITIRHLLQHRSGIGNYTAESLKSIRLPNATKLTTEQVFAGKTSTKFGEYCYSNLGYELMALIIEEKSGVSYEDYVRHNILEPLGLDNTFMNDEIETVDGVVVIKNHPEKSIAQANCNDMSHLDHLYDRAAGGIYASAADVAKFTQAFFAGKFCDLARLDDTTKLIKTGNEATPHIGLGFYVLDKKLGEKALYRGHGGGGGNSPSCINFAIHDANSGNSAVCLMSTENETLRGFEGEITREIMQYHKGLSPNSEEMKAYLSTSRKGWDGVAQEIASFAKIINDAARPHYERVDAKGYYAICKFKIMGYLHGGGQVPPAILKEHFGFSEPFSAIAKATEQYAEQIIADHQGKNTAHDSSAVCQAYSVLIRLSEFGGPDHPEFYEKHFAAAKQSAELGNSRSMQAMALAYRWIADPQIPYKINGIKQEDCAAMRKSWLEKAVAAGNDDAKENLSQIVDKSVSKGSVLSDVRHVEKSTEL